MILKGVFHYSNSRNLLNLRNLTDIPADYVKTTLLRQNQVNLNQLAVTFSKLAIETPEQYF